MTPLFSLVESPRDEEDIAPPSHVAPEDEAEEDGEPRDPPQEEGTPPARRRSARKHKGTGFYTEVGEDTVYSSQDDEFF